MSKCRCEFTRGVDSHISEDGPHIIVTCIAYEKRELCNSSTFEKRDIACDYHRILTTYVATSHARG